MSVVCVGAAADVARPATAGTMLVAIALADALRVMRVTMNEVELLAVT